RVTRRTLSFGASHPTAGTSLHERGTAGEER
ncbi:MAG: hypothetical protein QOJ59_2987, partial [Thermomicrobiales bacterium]|nr:hypothetical protein [Thermomicrobiales bacterium]